MTSKTAVRRVVRKAGSVNFPYQEQDVRHVSERLAEPPWLAERRMQAWRQFEEMAMPSLGDEAWRRTDIRPLPAGDFALKPVSERPLDAGLRSPLAGDAHGSLLVLRPGLGSEQERFDGGLDEGVIFCDWATAVREHADVLKAHLGEVVADGEGKFSALAAALAEDGVLVYVPAGLQVSAPLHSILWTPGVGRATLSRLLVVVEQGAALTFVHEAASPTEQGAALHAGIVEIRVGPGASLKFVELQNFGEHTWNFSHERARLGRDARLEWIFGAVGSHLTKTFAEIDLHGEGAEGRMSGFYIANGHQHLDHDTQQNHLAPHTTSDLLYKGALTEQGRSVWRGMIYVAPGAQKTDGYQANRNLILSKGARADSIPGLEILADDVRCTHGATVSQLEEEPVFYLMTRGLPRPEAERLVIDGFFAPIMERIPFEGVRTRFKEMIDAKLGAR